MWQKSKTKNVTKLKNSNCNKTQELKLWQNSKTQLKKKKKTQIVTKFKTWKHQFMTKLNFGHNFKGVLLVRTTWYLNNQRDVLRATFCDHAMFSFSVPYVYADSLVKEKKFSSWQNGVTHQFLKTIYYFLIVTGFTWYLHYI